MIRYTNGHIEDWYNGLNPEQLHFEWINANHKDYVVFQNNVKIYKLYKKLDIKIDKPYKLPFDVYYSTWGTSVSKFDNQTIVKDITFNSDIDSIVIKNLDHNRNNITINYKYGDNITFIDFKKVVTYI